MSRPHIAIVGAGFGGLATARALAREAVDVTVVDRRNYHLFQPLLYQVATAGLSPADIAHPVRGILRSQSNARFRMGEVTGCDFTKNVLLLADGWLAYDALIVAPGGQTNFFGNAELQSRAFGLKDVDDAIAIRDHVLTTFEAASHEPERVKRQALLTFVVVGGGPTGVECAGAISELIRLVLVRDFRDLDMEDVRVLLVESGPAVLDAFAPDLREKAVARLRRKNVEVRLNSRVQSFDGLRVAFASGETIPSHTMVWGAGVRAASLIETLALPTGKQGRAIVDATLQAHDHPGVFVIGDAACLLHDGAPLPMVAPVAIQQGRLAARNACAMLRGGAMRSFAYKDPGSLATIGRNAAVAQFGRWHFAGFTAWAVWLVVHLIQLIGFRNRLVVLVNWAWQYVFYDYGVRLIFPKRR